MASKIHSLAPQHPPGRISQPGVPLCVDLDGTLLKTDLLLEQLVVLLRTRPMALFGLFWLAFTQGLAAFKRSLADQVSLNVTTLPYHKPLLHYLEQQARKRPLWLCTGTDQHLAEAVARHLRLFEGVIGSDGTINMTGHNKARHLLERFGSAGFDYIGNEKKDLAIWQHSRRAQVVTRSRQFARWVRNHANLRGIFWTKPLAAKHYIKAVRAHQWSKNVLILVPLLLGHGSLQPQTIGLALATLVAFCALASATYIFNDLMDLESDRQHHEKRNRPYASGQISLTTALALIPALLMGCLIIASQLPTAVGLTMLLYGVVTLSYTLWLKHQMLIDVFVLAGLYTLRIVIGMMIVGGPPSFWLMAFSLFFFLSLAMAKRVTEITNKLRLQPKVVRVRGYQPQDNPLLTMYGSGCGIVSTLIITLYINSEKVRTLYALPELLWLLCPVLLFWLARVWMLTYRGELHEDPVLFAIRDRTSQVLIGLSALIVLLAANGEVWFG
ncbi:UbiA family prenyltransferase [Ferrimonas balearica]|uniref:UbiA family prenyltransferase n=1 Tax=Ferrimonas balearica TaxID=44012 RepID=UPI001C96635B|nr:UbiA family prenyltransferase [Ferrimonas balearica]MBY6223066.1 UbiA family prenyltransferase [Ferrimonas balearica]